MLYLSVVVNQDGISLLAVQKAVISASGDLIFLVISPKEHWSPQWTNRDIIMMWVAASLS